MQLCRTFGHGLHLCRVAVELFYLGYHALVGNIFLLDNYSSSCVAENHCIVILMISCNDRRRDKYRSLSCGFKLRQCGSSRAADNKVSRRKTNVHIVYVLGNAKPVGLQRYACGFHSLRKGLLSHAAVAVDMVYIKLFSCVPLDDLGHGIVDTACTETAAEREYSEAVAKAQLLPCLLAAHGIYIASYGKSCNAVLELALVHEFESFFYSEHNVVHLFREELIRHARIGILLMDSGRYAHSCSLAYHRTCRIAACADSDIGLEALYYLLCS